MHPNRRQFTTAAVGFTVTAPNFVRALGSNDRLNIALVGAGGRGMQTMPNFAKENIVALVDVDESFLGKAGDKNPQAAKYRDFRKLFDAAAKFDAVVVSTTEHTHYHATMLALKAGKHVYCEKPLTHNIWEARQIRLQAEKTKTATQMGIQMHATENMRKTYELVQSGVIGPIREVHVWVSRAWGLQSEEAAKRNKDIVLSQDSFRMTDAVPKTLDWDLWLAGAPARPFNAVYHPGPKWYRFWDFGNGTMSDLGSHWNDLAFWSLKLQAPLSVEAFGGKAHPDLAPATMAAVYEYPARGDLPACKMHWYQGEMKPKPWTDKSIPQWANGILFVGDKGQIIYDYQRHMLLPEGQFKDFQAPAASLPRVTSHFQEWIDAAKTGKQPSANFQYSGWLTEANHLGNVAYRVGKKLVWDAAALRASNALEADALIKREYRKGWDGLV
jgi:predicted dehydrogenase